MLYRLSIKGSFIGFPIPKPDTSSAELSFGSEKPNAFALSGIIFPLEFPVSFLIAVNMSSDRVSDAILHRLNRRPQTGVFPEKNTYMAINTSKRKRIFLDLALPFRIICGFLFAAIVTLTVVQVFCRFVLDSPLIWSEELVRLFLVWLTFLGAAVLCWDGNHLNVDTVFIKIPPGPRRWVRGFNRAVAIVFLIILVYYSIPLVQIDHMTMMSAFDIPASVVRVPATIGGGLMIFYIICRWLYRNRLERRIKAETFDDSTDPM